MDEHTKKNPVYCLFLKPVFHLLSFLMKAAVLLTALALSYLVFVILWIVYVDTYGDTHVIKLLNESARIVVRDTVGIEKFQLEQVDVRTAVFDGAGGNWKVLLKEPFHLDATRLLQEDVRNDLLSRSEQSDEILLDYLERFYSMRPTGYVCFEGEDITTGPGTLCDGRSLRKCNFSVCVKEGEKLAFLSLSYF